MKFVVAVVAPRGYAHSAAFDEVALTVAEGLRRLGHDADIAQVADRAGWPAAERTIVLAAHLLPRVGLVPPPGAVLYNFEQVDEGSAWLTPALLALYRAHPVWDYSAENAQRLLVRGVPAVHVVPLGYVPGGTRVPAPGPAGEDIDVLFYGSLNERRRRVLTALERAGLRVHAAFGVYGAARDALVARAKLVLNVHYYEAKIFEVVRVAHLLANHKVVVSERGACAADEARFADAVVFAAYDELALTCQTLLADPARRARQAAAGFAAFAALPEEAFLAPALAALPPAPPSPAADPWAGSRPLRVLLAPELADPSDRHEAALGALAADMGHMPHVTIGVALPQAALDSLPASITRAIARGEGDLLLLEQPSSTSAWQHLLASASLFVATSAQPELRALARGLGLTVIEAAGPETAATAG